MREKIIDTIQILFGVYLFLYLMFVIGTANFDIFDWHDSVRGSYAMLVTYITVMAVIIRHVKS